MEINLKQIRSGKRKDPLRVLLYGPGGIGKSYWAAQWPDSIVLDIEDGLGGIDCSSLSLKEANWENILEALNMLAEEEHQYRTVIIDSLDWCERLMHIDIANDRGVGSIGDLQFGAGYVQALSYFERMIKYLELLRSKGVSIVLLCHAKVVSANDPMAAQYQRFGLSLNAKAAEKMAQWADCVLFARMEISLVTEQKDFGGTRKRAGGGERRLYCNESPSFTAKNRYALPDEMPLEYPVFANHINSYFGDAK